MAVTKVNENEVTVFSDIPKGMLFFLDHQYRVRVRFTDPKDGREFPVKHPVVRAFMYSTLAHGYHRLPTSREIDGYMQRGIATALEEFRRRPNPSDELLARESVIEAVTILLLKRGGKFLNNLTKLRDALEDIATEWYLETDRWPDGSHFHDYLLTRLDLFKRFNVKLDYKRTKNMRQYTLEWIDEAAIPEWEMTQGDAIEEPSRHQTETQHTDKIPQEQEVES